MGFVLRYLTELRKKMCGLKQERGICALFTLCVLFMMMVTGDRVFTLCVCVCVCVCVYDQVFTLCVLFMMMVTGDQVFVCVCVCV